MTRPQILRTEAGDELVVLTRPEYDALLAAAGDGGAEARAVARIVEASDAAIARGDEILLPDWLAIETARGETPFKVIRRRLGRTKHDVAQNAGVSQRAVSDLERGGAEATQEIRARIAAALDVDPAWLEA